MPKPKRVSKPKKKMAKKREEKVCRFC